MDDRRTYMNKQLVRPDPPSKSGGETDVSYAELHFKTLSDPRVRTGGDRLTSTYSELNFRQGERHIEDEDIPTASRPAELRVTAQTAAQERESKLKIGNRPYRLICLLCLVTLVLIVTVAGLSIYGIHNDLRHQFTEMETKYRFVNETKAQICELLTRRSGQTCSENWVTNKDRCYYVSTFEATFLKAIQECSSRDSRLMEINSTDEASFVSRNLASRNLEYWIGKCENGTVGFGLLYIESFETTTCHQCDLTAVRRSYPCDRDQRFICEKPAPLIPDTPEKIQGVCQQPVEAT